MEYANPDALVSTDWLALHLDDPDIRIVDATSFLPTEDRDGRTEYDERHIPGAVYFDINDIADSDLPLPHMLPSSEKFASKVGKLGLGDDNRIVVYDANGGYNAACRAWWMFRVFGRSDIAVLDGGLPKWLAENRPLEDIKPTPQECHFTVRMDQTLVREVMQLLNNIQSGREQVVDARSPERFRGAAGEPRPCHKLGHIPGSLNLPFPRLMSPDDHFTMQPANEIADAIDDAGIDPEKPVVCTCGSGVTAAVIAFSMFLLGYESVAVYDGSWAEWGDHPDTPVEN